MVQEQADGHAGPVRVRLRLSCQSPVTVALCSPQRERGRGSIKAAAVDDHVFETFFLQRLICVVELDSFYKQVIRNPVDSEENPKHVILSVGGGNWVLTPPFPVESVGGKCILSRP